ncbi:MAG: Sir2 family NAD-dependent protein deacetylase, partial [Paracoccaceae bacterium]
MTIVIFTGAGVSAESGLGTFRDAGGLWARYPLEAIAYARTLELNLAPAGTRIDGAARRAGDA